MPSFKAVVIPGDKRGDGTYNVKIRVLHNRGQRRIPTSLYARPSDLTRSLKIKNPEILSRCDDLIVQMRAAIADVNPFDLEDMTVSDMVEHIRSTMKADAFRLDFFTFADSWITCKAPTTRRNYEGALRSLERYLGRRELDVNDITRGMLLDFAEFVEAEPKMHYDAKTGRFVPSGVAKDPRGAAARHIMKLGHLFQRAKDRYNDEDRGKIVIPRSPFSSLKLSAPPPTHGQRNLGVEVVQRIIDARPEDPVTLACLDVFRLSFVLMGANLADLYEAGNGVSGEWAYNRKKTRDRRADRAEMRVPIPPEAAPYIARLQDGPKGWWLPALHRMAKTKDLVGKKVNYHLRAWAAAEGLPPFTLYAARHSWASIARKAGVEKATVDEGLGHVGDFDITDIYAERSWEIIAAGNRRVLDLFRWE